MKLKLSDFEEGNGSVSAVISCLGLRITTYLNAAGAFDVRAVFCKLNSKMCQYRRAV